MPIKKPLSTNSLECTPSFCESDNSILILQGLSFSKLKIIISLLTLNVLFPFLTYWSLLCRKHLLFRNCGLSEATYFWIENKDGTQSNSKKLIAKVKPSHNIPLFETIGFLHRNLIYHYDASKNSFKVLEMDIQIVFNDILKQFGAGLTSELYQDYRSIYGPCFIEIRIPTIFRLFIREILSPINFLQILCLALWGYEDYYIYASVVFGLSITSAILNLIIIRSHFLNLNSMTNNDIDVEVIRVNNYQKEKISIKSRDLVPGDIIVLENGLALPCDCILLNNHAVVNEVNINGEPTPKIKSGIPYTEKIYSIYDKNYTLFDGSIISQVKTMENQAKDTLALVIRTGFYSVKGELFRSIIYSTHSRLFFLLRQFFKYILIMFGLAIIGNTITLAELNNWSDSLNIAINFLDLFTVAIAPALPTCIFIGIFISIKLLKKSMISCYSPYRLLTAGSMDYLFLDKTGTITEKDLHLKKVIMVYESKFMENIELIDNKLKIESYSNISNSAFIETFKEIFNLASCCHNILEIERKNGEKELSGDNIDLKIFKFSQGEINFFRSNSKEEKMFAQAHCKIQSKWKQILRSFISESNDPNNKKFIPLNENKADESDMELFSLRPELIPENPVSPVKDLKQEENEEMYSLKTFEFSSEVQRMSLIVYSKLNNSLKCFTKGSPEALKELCKASSIPADYNQKLLELTKQGFVVLSMGYKNLEFGSNFQLSVLERKNCEDDLIFLGFFIFENSLKKDSIESFKYLNQSGIDPKIVTGDSATTALVIAHKIGLVADLNKTVLIDYQDSKILIQEELFSVGDAPKKLEFSTFLVNLEKDAVINYERMFLMKSVSSEGQNYLFLNYPQNNILPQRHQILSTSTPFLKEFFIFCKQILDYDIAITGKAFNYLFIKKFDGFSTQEKKILQLILKSTKIYSRMLPMDKANLIKLHQKMGYTVGMVGDGLNDAAALKQADVGLSFSESNVNLSSSFSTLRTSLSSFIDLLKEGRKTMSNISHTFKYFALYSLIQFTNVNVLAIFEAGITDAQELIEDLFLATFLVLASSLTAASSELSNEIPVFDIFSVQNIFSLLGSGFIQFGGQVFIILYVRSQKWFNPYRDLNNDLYEYCAYCQEGNAVFLYSVILLINSILMTGNFQPDREPFYKNRVFILLFLSNKPINFTN